MEEGSRAHLSNQAPQPHTFHTTNLCFSLAPSGLLSSTPQPRLPESLMAPHSLLAPFSLYFHLPSPSPLKDPAAQTPRPRFPWAPRSRPGSPQGKPPLGPGDVEALTTGRHRPG